MDIREFSDKIAQATKNMSEDERQSLMKMFETVSDEIASVPKASAQASAGQNSGVADTKKSNRIILLLPQQPLKWMRTGCHSVQLNVW